MASRAENIRAFRGPTILSAGFRPFFLGAALWAALAMAVWLPMLSGTIALPTHFPPVAWHVHELIFGYVPAVLAGFLLTAVPNWTGRLPVIGRPLGILFAVWVAGRGAILISHWIGADVAAAVDLAFLFALGAVVAREILAAGNTRNLIVLAAISALFVANALFHTLHLGGLSDADFGGFGARLGVATTVFLISLIGGRIIPSFTRNWLAQRGAENLPQPFGRVDVAALVATVMALLMFVAMPEHVLTASLATLACGLNVLRMARWCAWQTASEPLVLILHVGFAFVPLGFLLVCLASLRPDMVLPTGALHAWTTGAIGVMTLAVMTRASLGHTGRKLVATPAITAIYVLAVAAALARIVAAFGISRELTLALSASAWVLAFAIFAVVYAPMLAGRRI